MEDNVIAFGVRAQMVASDPVWGRSELERVRAFNDLMFALKSGHIPMSPSLPHEKE